MIRFCLYNEEAFPNISNNATKFLEIGLTLCSVVYSKSKRENEETGNAEIPRSQRVVLRST